jgi:two-component system, response regulator YesN
MVIFPIGKILKLLYNNSYQRVTEYLGLIRDFVHKTYEYDLMKLWGELMKGPFFKVLIVDDEPLIREGIAEGIEWRDFNCEMPLCAENGMEAVDIIKKNKVDIVITDIKMPGMTGLELSKWIKENCEGISTLILTGYDDFKFAQNAIRYGVVDFILKPTKLEEIEASVLKIVKKLEEREKSREIIQEAKKIISINKREEIAKMVYSLIFEESKGKQVLKDIMDENEFNPYILQVGLLEIDAYSNSSDETGNNFITYITYMEDELKNRLADTEIEFIPQLNRNCIIVLFYSSVKNMDKDYFMQTIENAASSIYGKFKEYFPFNMNLGLSEVHKDINSVKNMYYNALRKLESKRASKFYFEIHQDLEEVNIEEVVDSNFRELIYRKDIQQILRELESVFKKMRENSITYYKSAAIELINYVDNAISKSPTAIPASRGKIYSQIIESKDIRDIEYIVKETIRSFYTSIEGFETVEESNDLEHRILDYIKVNYHKNLTLEEVAGKFYVSSGHLNRIIKRSMGKTFLDLLTEIRVKNAEILLRNPKYKAYEVANAVGFKDPKYFSQVFKKYTGRTPSEFK